MDKEIKKNVWKTACSKRGEGESEGSLMLPYGSSSSHAAYSPTICKMMNWLQFPLIHTCSALTRYPFFGINFVFENAWRRREERG
jgi:hypothetical protein